MIKLRLSGGQDRVVLVSCGEKYPNAEIIVCRFFQISHNTGHHECIS